LLGDMHWVSHDDATSTLQRSCRTVAHCDLVGNARALKETHACLTSVAVALGLALAPELKKFRWIGGAAGFSDDFGPGSGVNFIPGCFRRELPS
jgi:hypothetical protein